MSETLSSTKRIARKDYECNACLWFKDDLLDFRSEYKLTFTEWREIAKAKANKWKILKGQEYIDARIKFEGMILTIRSIEAIHKICSENDIYQE